MISFFFLFFLAGVGMMDVYAGSIVIFSFLIDGITIFDCFKEFGNFQLFDISFNCLESLCVVVFKTVLILFKVIDLFRERDLSALSAFKTGLFSFCKLSYLEALRLLNFSRLPS
jgi:hypothetical protein